MTDDSFLNLSDHSVVRPGANKGFFDFLFDYSGEYVYKEEMTR